MSGSANTHAVLAPSASKRWMNCTASVQYAIDNANRIPEDTSSIYADEGTKAHDYAEQILNGEITLKDIPLEFRQPVSVYVEECRRLAKLYPGVTQIVEEKAPLFYSNNDYGTVDFAVLSDDYVVIRDLKYGAGVFVEVKENFQLIIYAMSIIEDNADLFDFHGATVVDIGIAQPRHHAGDPVRSWVITLNDLKAFCEDVHDAVALIDAGDVEFAPGVDTCQWCDCKAFCEARRESLMESMPGGDRQIDFLALLPDMSTKAKAKKVIAKTDPPAETFEDRCNEFYGGAISDEDLVTIWNNQGGITSFLNDIGDYLTKRALAGDPADGTKIVVGRQGNRTWTDDEAALRMLAGQKFSLPERTTSKVISISAAEKLLASKLTEGLPTYSGRLASRFKDLTFRSPGKDVLAHESDPRPAKTAPLDALKNLSNEAD